MDHRSSDQMENQFTFTPKAQPEFISVGMVKTEIPESQFEHDSSIEYIDAYYVKEEPCADNQEQIFLIDLENSDYTIKEEPEVFNTHEDIEVTIEDVKPSFSDWDENEDSDDNQSSIKPLFDFNSDADKHYYMIKDEESSEDPECKGVQRKKPNKTSQKTGHEVKPPVLQDSTNSFFPFNNISKEDGPSGSSHKNYDSDCDVQMKKPKITSTKTEQKFNLPVLQDSTNNFLPLNNNSEEGCLVTDKKTSLFGPTHNNYYSECDVKRKKSKKTSQEIEHEVKPPVLQDSTNSFLPLNNTSEEVNLVTDQKTSLPGASHKNYDSECDVRKKKPKKSSTKTEQKFKSPVLQDNTNNFLPLNNNPEEESLVTDQKTSLSGPSHKNYDSECDVQKKKPKKTSKKTEQKFKLPVLQDSTNNFLPLNNNSEEERLVTDKKTSLSGPSHTNYDSECDSQKKKLKKTSKKTEQKFKSPEMPDSSNNFLPLNNNSEEESLVTDQKTSSSGPSHKNYDSECDVQKKKPKKTCIKNEQKFKSPGMPDSTINFLPLNNNSEEDSLVTEQKTSSSGLSHKSQRDWSKKACCLFCGRCFTKLPRHWERKHKKKLEVARILAQPLGSVKRFDLIQELKNKGNFVHNSEVIQSGTGKLIPKKIPTGKESENSNSFLPCIYCRAFFKKGSLSKHIKNCKIKKTSCHSSVLGRNNIQSKAALLLPAPVCIYDNFKRDVFKKMKVDKVYREISSDRLILEYGSTLYKKHENHQHGFIAQKMREIGRFLIVMKEMDHSISSLEDCFLPRRILDVIAGLNQVAEFNSDSRSYGTPSLVLKLAASLKKCGQIAIGNALRLSNNSQKTIVENFIQLFSQKVQVLTSRSLKTLTRRK